MIIPDLQEFPPTHPPTPYGFRLPIRRGEKYGSGFLPADTVLRAVGWLGSQVRASGDTPEDCVDKLFGAYERGLVLSDGSAGFHNCEICTEEDQHYPGGLVGPVIRWRGRELRLYGHGHFLLRYQNIIYMFPALILHYVLDHHYRPPDEFVEAVVNGIFLTAEDLVFVEIDWDH